MDSLDPKKEIKGAICRQFAKWSVFGVLLSLLPFVIDFGQYWLDGKEVQLKNVVGSGQLLLVAVALTGAAIGEVLFYQHKWNWMRVVAGSGAVIMFLLCAFSYPVVSKPREADKSPVSSTSPGPSLATEHKDMGRGSNKKDVGDTREDKVTRISVIFFVASWIVASGCIITSELK